MFSDVAHHGGNELKPINAKLIREHWCMTNVIHQSEWHKHMASHGQGFTVCQGAATGALQSRRVALPDLKL